MPLKRSCAPENDAMRSNRRRIDETGAGGPLLRVDEAAMYLGVRPGTLRNWLSERRLPYVKIGRLTKLSQRALDEFIAMNTIEAI